MLPVISDRGSWFTDLYVDQEQKYVQGSLLALREGVHARSNQIGYC